MPMRACVIAVMLVVAGAVLAERTSPVYEINLAGELDIGPDGSVHDYRLKSDSLSPEIAEAIDKHVHGWKFKPFQVDGKPVIAQTRLRISLVSMPTKSERHRLKIKTVCFGEPKSESPHSESRHKVTPPSYPLQALRLGMGAKVVLVLRLDEEGNVVDAHPEQTFLTKTTAGERAAARWRRVFEKESIAAVKGWKYDMAKLADGKTMPSILRVPLNFTIGKCDQPRKCGQQAGWRRYFPGPRQPAPWATDGDLVMAGTAGPSSDGQTRPPSFRRCQRRDEVIGAGS